MMNLFTRRRVSVFLDFKTSNVINNCGVTIIIVMKLIVLYGINGVDRGGLAYLLRVRVVL